MASSSLGLIDFLHIEP